MLPILIASNSSRVYCFIFIINKEYDVGYKSLELINGETHHVQISAQPDICPKSFKISFSSSFVNEEKLDSLSKKPKRI